jgi:hypothetical protein
VNYEQLIADFKASIAQYEEGAIEAHECFNWIAHKVCEALGASASDNG